MKIVMDWRILASLFYFLIRCSF